MRRTPLNDRRYKLWWHQVLLIRTMLRLGYTGVELSKQYNVTNAHITNLRYYKRRVLE